MNDGASCVVVCSEEYARSRGLEVLATIVGYAAVADDFAYLARTPAKAGALALEQAGRTTADVSRVEINEAFASVASNSTRMLGVDEEIVNVNGGAIALGHPIGASGGRIVGTLVQRAPALRRRARPGSDLLGRRAGRRPAGRGLTAPRGACIRLACSLVAALALRARLQRAGLHVPARRRSRRGSTMRARSSSAARPGSRPSPGTASRSGSTTSRSTRR